MQSEKGEMQSAKCWRVVVFIMRHAACLLLLNVTAILARDAETALPEAREDFVRIIGARFAAWDADASGELSKAEINALVADGAIKGDEAATVAALKRASRMTKVTLPPFTLANLREQSEGKPEKGMPDFPAMFSGGVKRIAAAKRVLFASGKPRLDTVRQGRMGNCFSLAPLGAIANLRPEYIADEMIRELPDGRYEVRLGKTIVRVTAPTDAELALTAMNESDGIWVNVYEKAAGEAHNALKPQEKREATGLDALNRGGSAGTQLAFITGHEMVRFSCKFAKDDKLPKEKRAATLNEMRAALSAAVKERRLMTCGTLKTTIPGITPNHAYAVLGYDSATDQIRLWNPHGDTTKVKGEPGLLNPNAAIEEGRFARRSRCDGCL